VGFLKTYSPSIAVVVITGFPDRDKLRQAEELEVCSFLTKPFSVDQLKFAVFGALEKQRMRCDVHAAADQMQAHGDFGLVGVSAYMQELRRHVALAASGEFPVLIEGGSGTGKEVIAHAIHNNSSRKAERMIIVNCAAIPQHLEEAEFFGHVKGAFTGAMHAREGIIATADTSTLFLDEVGDLSLGIQAKLLRVLENKQFQRLGENAVRQVDIRIISATNRRLEAMIAQGQFRDDLYYRLKGDMIVTKPLGEHAEDIPSLVHHFVARESDTGAPATITAEAVEYLAGREWPGDIRELKHSVRLLCHAARGRKRINMATVEAVIKGKTARPEPDTSYKVEKSHVLGQFEKDYFARLLNKYEGNLNRASREAGMDRSNLIKKLKALGIRADEYRKKNG